MSVFAGCLDTSVFRVTSRLNCSVSCSWSPSFPEEYSLDHFSQSLDSFATDGNDVGPSWSSTNYFLSNHFRVSSSFHPTSVMLGRLHSPICVLATCASLMNTLWKNAWHLFARTVKLHCQFNILLSSLSEGTQNSFPSSLPPSTLNCRPLCWKFHLDFLTN